MEHQSPKIWLLGTSFDTTNMGLSALTEGTLRCILNRWPHAQIIIPTPYQPLPQKIKIADREVEIQKIELWYGRNFFKTHNWYALFLASLWRRLLPFNGFQKFLAKRNPCYAQLLEADMVMDITGGDSFTDLYKAGGFKFKDLYKMDRLIHGSIGKWVAILNHKPLILLPQTYGPFKSRITQWIAKSILNHASAILARDQESLAQVESLLDKKASKKNIAFVPDVAFVLQPVPIQLPLIEDINTLKKQNKRVIGLNVSGILYNEQGAYAERFALNIDYHEFIHQLIEQLLAAEDTVVVLISHVFAPLEAVESDPLACQQIYQHFQSRYPQRILSLEERLDHREVKYLIGQCDFFLGSRMHACIGAISQCVPTVGLAYSGKFIGVFASAGVADAVLDLRQMSIAEILAAVDKLWQQRQETATHLQITIPNIQRQVLQLFAAFPDEGHQLLNISLVST